MAKEQAVTRVSEETADSLAILASDVLQWGGGDVRAFLSLVASGIDSAPAAVRAGFWRVWLRRASE